MGIFGNNNDAAKSGKAEKKGESFQATLSMMARNNAQKKRLQPENTASTGINTAGSQQVKNPIIVPGAKEFGVSRTLGSQ